ncbi:MAG: serine hydrolase [Sphingomonas sp.]|nr:serine hydrolase [Sphingomonas sp.]
MRFPHAILPGLLLATIATPALAQTVAPTAPATAAPAGPSPAVIHMRRQWLNPEINSFTFRDNARFFDTRKVARQGRVRPLPLAPGFTMPAGYEAFAEATYTNALLVIRDGKILFEDYRNRSDASTHFISFSMAKSITSILMGIALDKGLIRSIDDPVTAYLPELKGGGYDGVSLRHILQMRSGVDYEERYDFGDKPSLAAQNHENAIVQNKVRFADSARTIGRKWSPGSQFNYATLDTAVLGWTLERATGQPLATFTQANLWGPAGMEADAYWLADGPQGVGRELSGMGYNATLRDFGRLGLLMLDHGKRSDTGEAVVPASWLKQATTMVPTGLPDRTGYGFQFWQIDDEPGAYAAVGLAGQFIYVHPATKTVIVKLSYFPPDAPPSVTAETVRYFKAITSQR